MFYFCTFSLFLFLHYLSEDIKKYKFPLIIFSLFYLIVITGFRMEGVGTDDHNYVEIFQNCPSLIDIIFYNVKFSYSSLHTEYGYTFLNLFLKSFINDYSVLFLLIGAIAISLNIYNYYKYSPYVFISILLYFSHTFLYRELNQIRAGVAVAIGLCTIKYIEEKKHQKFFLLICIGSLFHIAILCLLLPYCLSFIKLNRKKTIIILLISFVFGIISISSILIGLIPGNSAGSLKSILNYAQSSSYNNNLGFFNITNIKSLFFLCCLIFFWDKLKNKIKYFNTISLFYLLSVCWRFAFHDFSIIAGRIATFYECVEVIIIPFYITLFKEKKFCSLIILIYSFVQLYLNVVIIDRNLYIFNIGL